MAIFKCKMCGGTIEFEPGATVGICDSCGTKQTLPRLDDDRRANLYDRANHFRRNNEFDKASGIYEQILNEDGSDAEAYWSLVLCRYGIEYVEDPGTHQRIPTVNRAQYTSIFDDDNYKSALQHADSAQKALYEAEAQTINRIQKGILEISQKEEPFDVFICYKETDQNGRRTQDSVLANDLYHQLTQEGFKVFFARITLEDKLGSAYEPYIFAALNSAKVMVVLGTKPEYFNAVWVKNEWSRYLALIKAGAKKTLIPAYRDMDPYDLPDEFSHLQAQDMSKLGFMQDLILGIQKITRAEEPKASVVKETVIAGGSVNTAALLKRAFMFLEDGNWEEADSYCEKVLDQEPENAQAYLGKLMAEVHVKHKEDLADCANPFDNRNSYQKVIRFGDKTLASELQGYVAHIRERNETARQTKIYEDGCHAMETAQTEQAYLKAAELFQRIPEFQDAASLAERCQLQAEVCRKDDIYNSAKSQMRRNTISNYKEAIAGFQSISDWKDSEQQIAVCQRAIEEIRVQEELSRREQEKRMALLKRKVKKVLTICIGISLICIAGFLLVTRIIIPRAEYQELVNTYGEEAATQVSALKIGGTYTFGNYTPDDIFEDSVPDDVFENSVSEDGSNESDESPIEWRIVKKEGASVLLVSQTPLECFPYDSTNKRRTWEKSTLCSWLNHDFLETAFNEEEQALICNTDVSDELSVPHSPKYQSDGNTNKVFLLSGTEASKYFGNAEERQCAGDWWLRTTKNGGTVALYVNSDGSVVSEGEYTSSDSYVRPAIWITFAPQTEG